MAWQNPVLQRELIESLRHPRSFAVLTLFLALLSGIVLLAWPNAVNITDRGVISTRIYNTFALGQTALLALMAPILSAPAIAGERERRSLDLLLASPLTPGAIVRGKFLSANLYLVILAVSSLPIFALTRILGAVGPREMTATFLVMISLTALSGAIGLAASTWIGRTRAALSVSYVAIIPCVMLVLALNPLRDLTIALFVAATALTVAGVLTHAVIRRLREPFDPAPKNEDDPLADMLRMEGTRNGWLERVLSPRRGARVLQDGDNPMLDKELRFDGFGVGSRLLKTLLKVGWLSSLPFVVGSIVLLSSRLGKGYWAFLSYLAVYVILVGPSLAAGAFTQERERGTMDLLVTSGLSRERILAGKTAAPLRNVLVLAGLQLPLFALVAIPHALFAGPAKAWISVAGVLIVAATAVFTVRLAVFISLLSRTTLRSMVASYLTVGVLFVMTLGAYYVLTDFAGWPRAGAGSALLAITSPFHALARLEDTPFAPADGMLHVVVPILYIGLAAAGSFLLWRLTWALYPRYAQLHHERRR